MDLLEQIDAYIAAQPEPKQRDLRELHQMITGLIPECRLWFLDGKDENGRTVSNPNIGYGFQKMQYANGKTKEFYQVGTSANTAGISVYLMGIEDKQYLPKTYGSRLGAATVTGYCIKFKTLQELDRAVLEAALRDGIAHTSS